MKRGCEDSSAGPNEGHTWNCRGLSNGPAVQGLLALQKQEDPDVLFHSKTRLRENKMEKFRYKLGMPHMVVKDCEGKSGELALFWKRDVMSHSDGRGGIILM